jgi:predicted RNase H-like HicB family nuclease
MSYTAIYVRARDGAVLGFVLEAPGAMAQGDSIEETREHLRDALRLTLRANRRRSRHLMGGLREIHREPIEEMP